MISGVTLLDYRERYSTYTYIKKRTLKTFIPFLVWSFLGLIYRLLLGTFSVEQITLRWLIDSIINTKIISVYWYFIPQFAVYLFIPILSLIPKEDRKKIFQYIILMMLFLNIALPLIFSIVEINYNYSITIPLSGFSFYVVLGYYIDNYSISCKLRVGCYLLALCGLLLQIIGTWKLSFIAGEVVQTYKGYLNLPCVLYSMGIFMFFKYLDTNYKKVMNILSNITQVFFGTTLGVYLIHCYIVEQCLAHFSISAVASVFVAIVIFVCSALITAILQKIPIVRMIVPK